MSDKITVKVDPQNCAVLVIEIGEADTATTILLNRDEALSLLEQLNAHISEMAVKI